MSPRIYSPNEIRELIAYDRRKADIVIKPPSLVISRRALIRGGAALAAGLMFLQKRRAFAASFAAEMSFISVKDPTFGAQGIGSGHDDTTAIQAAFNYAYGSPASPHGNSGRFSNLGVYFPAGNFYITSPLYLVNVVGGYLKGLGPESTTLSFTNPNTGNTIIANGICPLIMTNGVSYTTFENMTMGSGLHTNAAGVYFFQDGTNGISTAPLFRNMLFSNFDDAILAGYQSSANCENGILEQVQFSNCNVAGLRVVGQNTLNWQVYGGSSQGCGAAGGDAATYSCTSGGMSPIVGMSSSGNTMDVVNNGFGGTTIIGGSSESNNFGKFIGTHAVITDLAWRPTGSLGTVFVDATNAAWINLEGVFLNPGGATGAGTAVALGNTGKLICKSIEMPSGGAQLGFTGINGSEISFENCDFGGVDHLSGFTGTVTSYIGDNNGATSINNTLVSKLPAAAAKYKGLTGSVTDGDASLAWGATVINSGAGATYYKIQCNGSAWTVIGK